MDASLFHFLYERIQDSRWLPFMRQLTHLGDPTFVTAMTLLGWVESIRSRERAGLASCSAGYGARINPGTVSRHWVRVKRRPPLLCWLGVPLAYWLTSGLKLVFGRLRPFEVYPALGISVGQMGIHPGDLRSAFPSGHATAAFALATALGYRWPRWRPLWFVLAGGVALSRVALGLHWPSDVAVGAAVGFLVVFGLERLEKNINQEGG